MKDNKYALYKIPRVEPGKPSAPENFFFDGYEQLYVHTAWRNPTPKPAHLAAPEDPCCTNNPQDPTVTITSVQFSADLSKIEVSVSASHPCGINTIEVYIAKVTYERSPLPPFELFRVIAPLTVGGQMIDTSSTNPFQGGGQVGTTLNLPVTRLVGQTFNVAVVAVNRCNKKKGAVSKQFGIF